ncbi:hypothetical protein BSKO_00277 [Bryopsis sp. KO-2023]|nr:hypothetical protein BSKO_00277 [Bryopsis sp. KO-2023]
MDRSQSPCDSVREKPALQAQLPFNRIMSKNRPEGVPPRREGWPGYNNKPKQDTAQTQREGSNPQHRRGTRIFEGGRGNERVITPRGGGGREKPGGRPDVFGRTRPRGSDFGTSLTSGASDDIGMLVEAMMGPSDGAVRANKSSLISSFEQELPKADSEALKVASGWLIDQARGALAAGASGRLSFAISSVPSHRDSEVPCHIDISEPYSPGIESPRDGGMFDLSVDANFEEDGIVARGDRSSNHIQNRRPAMDGVDFDASVLVKVSAEMSRMGVLPDTIYELAPVENTGPSSARSKKGRRTKMFCFLASLVVSTLFVLCKRKNSDENNGSRSGAQG